MPDDNVVVPVTFEVNKVVGTFDYDKVLLPKRLKRKNVSDEEFKRDTSVYQLHAEWVKGANLISRINVLQRQKELANAKKDAAYIAARSADRHLAEARTAGTNARTANTQARTELRNSLNRMMEIMGTPEYKAEKDAERQYRLSASALAKERLQDKIRYEQVKDENHERKINREEAFAKNKYLYQHNHDLIRKALAELRVTFLSTKIGGELQKIDKKREAERERQAGVKENIKLRNELWKERQEISQKNRIELIEKRAAYKSPLMKVLGGIGFPVKDLKTIIAYNKGDKNVKKDDAIRANDSLKAWAKALGIGAITYITKKTLTTIMNVSKKIVGVFVNAAKQAETLKNMIDLFLRPLVTMFTLLFVPVLIAAVPLIKTMFDWVISNKDAIMAVGEKLASIFNSDNLNIVHAALDGVLTVVNALATVFANNASMIDTSSLDRFISTTILAIANMIQDILIGVVAFCYSPEGKAFITSVAYSLGKVIGSVMETVVALIPMIIGAVVGSIIGLATSAGSYIYKAIFNAFDTLDKFFGGAISGVINSIVDIINTAINALNSINLFGYSPFNIPNINNGMPSQVGSSLSNFIDQGIVNNFHINNNMSLSDSSVLKDVMRTGAY